MSKEATFIYTILLFGSLIIMGITWILFARLTMARIEREIAKEGYPEKFRWDGIGGRIFFYAFAIVWPEKIAQRISKLIDVDLVRSYAGKGDWYRGLVFLTASNACMVLIFIGVVFDVYQ